MAKNWSRNSSCFWYNVQHETFFAEAKKLVLHEYLSRPLPKWVCIPHTIKVKGKKLFWLEFNSKFFFSCSHISDTGPILASGFIDFDLRPLDLSLSSIPWRTNLGQKALPRWFHSIDPTKHMYACWQFLILLLIWKEGKHYVLYECFAMYHKQIFFLHLSSELLMPLRPSMAP